MKNKLKSLTQAPDSILSYDNCDLSGVYGPVVMAIGVEVDGRERCMVVSLEALKKFKVS